MKKIKVVSPIFGLEVGDILTYNEEYSTWDFVYTNEDITGIGNAKDSRTVSLDDEFVDSFYEYFEQVSDNERPAIANNTPNYIKPVAIKAYMVVSDGNVKYKDKNYWMKFGDYIVKGIDGTNIPVDKVTFDKLFKIIL